MIGRAYTPPTRWKGFETRVLKPLATVLVALVALYILGSSPACQGRDQGPGPIELRDGCYMHYDANDGREHIVCP